MKSCTFCGTEIDSIIVSVELTVKASRKRTDDTWENIPNMNVISREELCTVCFDKFTDLVNSEMLKTLKKDK